jgi:hypothetical protein
METVLDFLRYSPFEYNMPVAVVSLIYGVFWFIVYNMYTLWHINDIGKDNRKIKILPPSISQTYYMIDVRWLFQMFMYSSIFSIICIGQSALYVIVGVMFTVMTVNPSVNSGNKFLIPHMIGAVSAITLGLLGLAVCFFSWNIVALLVIIAGFDIFTVIQCKRSGDEHMVYYIELISLSGLMVGFLTAIIEKF